MNVEEIAARISRKIRGKKIDLDDIANWCGIVEAEYLPSRQLLKKYKNVALKVVDLSAQLPCGLSRLLKVRLHEDGMTFTNYDTDGVKLTFNSTQTFDKNDDNEDVIYIDYYAVPVDDDNRPMVLTNHAEACVAYCIMEMHYEDYLTRQLERGAWIDLKTDWEYKLAGAGDDAGDLSEKEKLELRAIMYNIVPDIMGYSKNIY